MDLFIRITLYLLLFVSFCTILVYISKKYHRCNLPFLAFLFLYRIPFSFIYINFIPGDWIGYYQRAGNSNELFSTSGLGTESIVMFATPLVKLGLLPIDTFFAFSFAAYIGIVLFYLIGHRLTNYTDQVKVWGINIFPWILLYPSLHMYTVMLGKDPLVLLGLGLVGYSLVFFAIRKIYLLLGLGLLLLVRPHIVFVILTSLIIALLWSKEWGGIKKFILFLFAGAVAIISLPAVLSFFRVGEVSLEAIQLAIQLNEGYVSDAGTYIDMTAYPFWLKAFTYLYRPLFFDSPNLLLLEYSAENLVFLFLTLSLIRVSFFPWINEQPRILKFSLVFLIIGTLVLSNGLSVFGLFIRQKTMVFLFMILLITSFIHYRNQKVKFSLQ